MLSIQRSLLRIMLRMVTHTSEQKLTAKELELATGSLRPFIGRALFLLTMLAVGTEVDGG